MKKHVIRTLAAVAALVLITTIFAACGGSNYIENTARNADNYTIVISYDPESHKLSAVQTVEVTNRSDNDFSALKFHIYANCYREGAASNVVPSSYRSAAYQNGVSYGDISFETVKTSGKPAAFVIEGEDMDILSVPLDEPLYPNETATVEMTYEITLANIWHRLGYGSSTVNLGNFYPVLCYVVDGQYSTTPYYAIGDPFVTEMANYEVVLTVPDNYVVASGGELKEVTAKDGGLAQYSYSARAVRDFAMVLSSKFKKISKQSGDVTVNYYYFDDADAETTLDTAAGMLEFMNEKVGKYPYKQLSVAETDFCYGGMEYPNLVMVTSGNKEYQQAVSHEVGHQWFYGIVGNNQIEDAWMDEGLVEFMSMLYMGNSGKADFDSLVRAKLKAYTTYVNVLSHYFNGVDVSLRPVYKYKNDQEYVYMTYVKGSLLFDTLYKSMGENKFYKALARYFDDAKTTVAAPSQLFTAFTKAQGGDMSGFFEAFISGKDIIGKTDN